MMRTACSVLAVLLGLAWLSIAGLGAWGLLNPDTSDAATWAEQFPAWVRASGVAIEAVIAMVLLAGLHRRGLVGGIVWLVVLTALLIALPVPTGARCGCLGPVELTAVDPIARNLLLIGLHAGLLLAFCGLGQRGTPATRAHFTTATA